MTWTVLGSELLGQQIAETSTVQKHDLGQIVRCKDPTYGAGEFIYLQGVASTVVGSVVTYNSDDWTTKLVVSGDYGPAAVAMSINVASSYGWYQIQGKAQVKAAVAAENALVYIDTVPGYVEDAVVASARVYNAKFASASTAVGNIAEVEIARPFVSPGST